MTDATDGQNLRTLKRIKIRVLKTLQPNSFPKLIPAASNFKNYAQETNLFVSDLWFCHLHVISLVTLNSIVIEGE